MRAILKTLSWLSLGTTAIAPFLYFAGSLSLDTMKTILLLATLGWFVHAVAWVGAEKVTPS